MAGSRLSLGKLAAVLSNISRLEPPFDDSAKIRAGTAIATLIAGEYMTIKTILVPTDFSEPSVDALNYAKELATAFKASIHLLHVVQDPLAEPWGLESYGPLPPDVFRQIKARAQQQLEASLPEADRKVYGATLVTAEGAPFSQIIEYAKTRPIDLIVMGTHGRGALAHAILGSVAERVVRFGPCPVLTVRHK
jgi:nucleotide-binding universal stress UspA family protein